MFAIKEKTEAHVEVLLLKDCGDDVWECLCGNAKAIKVGTRLHFKDDILIAECIEVKDEGIRMLKFFYKGIFLEELDKIGIMPLPPYIHKAVDDNNKYQTVYAKNSGSSAAPTAGFHFTNELLDELKEMGVEILDITLSIGLGKKENRRIIAVGTTVVRTLEANVTKFNEFKAEKASTNIFITPGYTFKAIDCLITNFHLPKSTLIMLVSAFIGREFTLSLYNHAVKEKYMFFSFGDAMFIYGSKKN